MSELFEFKNDKLRKDAMIGGNMKLKALKSVVDKAVKRAGKLDTEVEVWFRGAGPFTIIRVGQFGVVPDVTIDIDVLNEGK